jgi:hypothetical protein
LCKCTVPRRHSCTYVHSFSLSERVGGDCPLDSSLANKRLVMSLRGPSSESPSTRAGRRSAPSRVSQARRVLCPRRRPGNAPKGSQGNVDGRANRGNLKLNRHFPELLDAARAQGAAIAYESSRLTVPLRINPVDRIFQHCCGAVVIFRGDENKPVRCGYLGGPAFDNLILVTRAAGAGRQHGLVKEAALRFRRAS